MVYVITLFKTKTQQNNCIAIVFKKKGSVVNKKFKENKHIFVFFLKKCIYILF